MERKKEERRETRGDRRKLEGALFRRILVRLQITLSVDNLILSSMDQRIYIPTTFTSEHLEGLMDIFHPLLKNTETAEVILDFSKCKFLGHHAVTIIGGLAYWLREKMASSLTLDTTTLEEKIYQNLDQNGFLRHLGQDSEPWDGNSIPFRHDHKFQKDELIQYLGDKWLGKGWIRISNELKSYIIATVLEIYLNAFEHGGSEFGVFSCGQYYPKLRRLQLTILDFGVGIPHNVRTFRDDHTLSAQEAIEWSLRKGNSTRPLPDTARGLGLDGMSRFISVNKGKLQIYSHDGYVKLSQNPPKYGGQTYPFQGTIVNINLVCDETYYCLSSELALDDKPFF
jgi:hypothetical protein